MGLGFRIEGIFGLGCGAQGSASFGWFHMGVSENRGPYYSTLNSRILIIRTPRQGTPNFRKLPHESPSWV